MSGFLRLFPVPGVGPPMTAHPPEFLKGVIRGREEDGSNLRYIIETREGRILRTRFTKGAKDSPDVFPGSGICLVLRNGEVLIMIALKGAIEGG